MAVHHPHLLDLSPPPNAAVAMEAPPSSFDHGLLALHIDGTDMANHRVVLADDTAASWPQPVSLSLFNNYSTAGAPLVGHQQAFTVPPAVVSVASNQLLPTTSMQPFQLRSSRYLGPVKELLDEFCSLEGDLHAMNSANKRAPKAGNWDDVEAASGLWGSPALSSMDLLELERRKARLLSMVEEVDRRYRRYREQMRAVEVSFEAVAGAGEAQVYTRLARRAMSRHFRCLRDVLVAQVRKAMGERGSVGAAPPAGGTKGDTPRLKVLDQCLRQQRAFQQPGAVDNYPWRPQRGLPERAVAVLRAWLFEHFLHPYPNDVDKHILAHQTGLSRSKVSNWFINARVRLWKPMIEDMYTEEVQQQSETNQNPNGTRRIIKPENNRTESATIRGGESQLLGTVENPNSLVSSSIVTDGDLFHCYPNFHGGGGGAMSLTLGFQQLPFSSSMMQQRSLMLQGEGEEAVVLPYRNLKGSQLLHDFGG